MIGFLLRNPELLVVMWIVWLVLLLAFFAGAARLDDN